MKIDEVVTCSQFVRWAFATMGRRMLRSFEPMGRGTHLFEGTPGFGGCPPQLVVGTQHDHTTGRSVELGGNFLGCAQLEAQRSASVGLAGSGGVVFAGNGPRTPVRLETSCEGHTLQLVQGDACSMGHEKLGWLLKQMSMC